MFKFPLFFLVIALLAPVLAYADALPFKSNVQIDLHYATGRPLRFDSCGVIYRNYSTQQMDTFFGCHGFECIAVADKDHIALIRPIPDSCRLILFYEGKTLTSPVLRRNGFVSYHRLLISDGGVVEDTPFFKTPYRNYGVALGATLFFELLTGLIYFYRRRIGWQNLKYIVLINLISHPALWLISVYYTGFEAGILVGEPLVWLAEAALLWYFLKRQLSTGQALWLSFQMNVVSFLLGGIAYFLAV